MEVRHIMSLAHMHAKNHGINIILLHIVDVKSKLLE